MPDGAATLDDIREELKRREKDAASLSDVQAELKRRQAKEHAAAPEKRSISGARPITPPAVPQRTVTPQRQQMQAKSSGDRFASTIGPAHPRAQPNLLQRIEEGFGAVLGYPKGLLAAAALPAHEALHSARGSAVKPTPAEKARDDANVKRLMRQNIFQRALSLEGQNPADPTLGRTAQQSQNARASRAQFHQGDVLMKFLGDVVTDPLTYLIGPANELLPPPARAALTASFATSMATSGAQKIHQGFTQHDPDLAFEGSLDLTMGAAAGKAAHGEAVDVRNTAARTGLIADHLVDRRGDVSPEFVDRLAKRYHVDPVKLARAYEKKAVQKAIPDHNGPAEVNARSEKIAAATEAARPRAVPVKPTDVEHVKKSAPAVPPKPIITEKAKEALRKKGEGETRTPAETKKVPPSATNTGGVDPTLSRRTEPVTEYPQATTNDPVMDRIRQQAAQEHKAKMDAIAGDRKVLHARLRDAVTVLNDAGRRTLGKGVLDFENKRLVSDDGTWALQWEPSQTTRGSVHMIRLKGIQDGLPRPLLTESPVDVVTKPPAPKQKGEASAAKQITTRSANKQMGERTNREAQGGDAGEYISAHSVTKASKPYRDPEALQGLIDSREDELVSQGVSLAGLADSSPQGRALIGHTVQGITYEAMPKDLDELYRERDRGYADQNYQAVEQAMGRVSKESKAGRITEDDIRKAVEESVQKHSLADAMQHPPSNIEQVFSNFYNNLAWERATADHSFPHAWVSLDHVLDVIRGGWKNSHYGSSPEPFVRQAASIFKDILGQGPNVRGLPALEPPKGEASAAKTGVRPENPSGQRAGNDPGRPQTVSSSRSVIPKTEGVQGEAKTQVTFKTAKGSSYRVHEDGTTTRDKAARIDIGHEGQQGTQPRSGATFYVTPEQAKLLGEIQAHGVKKIVAQHSDGSWGIKYLEGPSAGKFERRTMVKPETAPRKGLIPVEVWKGGSSVHFGNEIIEVYNSAVAATEKPPTKPATMPKAPTGAPHRDAALLSSAGRAEGLLSGKPKAIDDIAKEMGLSTGEAGVLLTFMELDGKVRRLPRNNYILTKPVETPKAETKPTATPPRAPMPPKAFLSWIDRHPEGKVYTKASDLYQAWKMEHPQATREEFGQMLQHVAASEAHEIITPSGNLPEIGVFTFKDSTGVDRRVAGVRLKAAETKPVVPPRPPARPLKAPYEMTADELGRAYEESEAHEKGASSRVFGAGGAKQYESARRISDRGHLSDPKVKEADRLIDQMERRLTDAQRRDLFGTGETGPDSEDYQDYQRAIGNLGWDSPADLGHSLRSHITDIGDATDPAKMTHPQQVAYAAIRHAMEGARRRGWNLGDVEKAALEGAASRFSDPEDAAFMLRRFAIKSKAPAGAPEAGAVHIKPDEAADIALRLGDHPLADAMERSATKGKAHPLTAEQVAELRGLLDKRSVPKGGMPTIFPEVVKPKVKAAPAKEMSDKAAGVAITKALAEKEGKPLGGAPPPDAPIVGGAPTVSGGSGRPSGFRLPVFERPTGTGLRSRWNEFTRRVSNWLNRGSAGIERHAIATGDPSLLRAQRKEAGSTQQVNIMRSHTMPLIRKAFGGSDAKTEQFFHYLAEGSLRGARQRWSDYHAQVLALPGPSVADPNILPKYLNALEQLEGRRRDHAALDDARDPETETSDDRIVDPADPRADRSHFAPGLVRRAENLASNGAYDELRILLANTFNQAHASVGVMADFDPGRAGRGAEDFDAYGEKTQVTAAMKHYKEGIGDPISRAYKANRGEASAYLGPLDTYFPLVPFRKGGGAEHIAAPKAAFSNVPTAGAKFKTGLSERYDTSKDTVLQAIGHQIRTNNRGALVNSLRDIGLAKDIPQGTRLAAGPQTIRIAGVDVPAVVRPWKESVKVVGDGKTYFTPGKNMLVAKFAADELQPQLEKGEYEPGALGKITQAYVFGPAAGLIHNWNLAASVVAGTPFVGRGLGKVPGSIPGLKMTASVTQGLSIDPMAPERAADLRELAEMGLLHPKTGTVTSSRAVAEQTGAKFRPDLSPLLYGMSGTEVRARLQLLDIARAVGEERGKEVTPEDKFNFISQAGIYANGLDSKIEQITKRAQVAPFITAGKNIIGTGTKALTGTTPLPRNLSRAAKMSLRARQLVSSGIVGATGLWFATFYAYTGRLPGKGDRFNQIPVKESDRNTWLGRKMFGKSPGQKYVSLDIANPALARGMHATGATALINGRMKGSDPDTIVAAMLKDQINGLGSPVFNAPAVRMASTALVGKEPYIVSWRGLKPNEVNPTFIDAVDQERMGVHRMAMQILNAALNSNSVTEIGGQLTGIGHRREDRKGESGDTVAFQTAWDLLFPRSVPFQVPQKQGGGGGKANYDRVGAGSGMEQIR